MATVIRQRTIAVPANTSKANPSKTALVLPIENTISVDLEVPPGPAGLMGFYLAMSGQQLIPFEVGEWIVWDDRFDTWYLDDYPQTGAWSVVAYNLDIANTHDIVCRFHNEPYSLNTPALPSVNIIQSASTQEPVTLG